MSVPRGKVGNSQHFPTNLHVLLDEAEKGNHSHIVSWCSQGHAFKIHDNDALLPLLAKYFRQTKFKSFLRQLQSYGFHRNARGYDKGVVSHPLFVRGRRSLSFQMSRKPKGSSSSQSSGVSPLYHSPPQPSSPASASAMPLTSVSAMELHSTNSRAVLSNNIMPLRKYNSAPVLFTSINNGDGCDDMMRSNKNNHNRLAAMNNLSGIKNETFQYQQEERSLQEDMEEPLFQHHQHQHSHSQNQNQNQKGLQVGMGMKKMKRRATANATVSSAHSLGPFHQQMTKRLSASAASITSEQRERLLQCSNIDYSSSTNGERILPQEALPMSKKESSSAGVLDGSNRSVAPISQLSQQVMIPTAQEVQSSGAQQQVQVELVQQQQVVYQPQYHHQQVQVRYLQEPQQYQQQQHRQEPPHYQIQQVNHVQQYRQEPQHQHQQVQHVDVQYQQEPQLQQQQVQLVYRQHQVRVPNNQVQVQQVKQHSGVHQMDSCAPQQQQEDQYQSAKLQLARQVQHFQQQQQQIQNQYKLSQYNQQQNDQTQQVAHQHIQCDQQLVQQQQQQQDDPHHIVQNQQKMIPQHQQQQQQLLVQLLREQNNGPVETRQVCSTGVGSNSGCHGSCHVHPGSPVCSHQQQHSSKGTPEMTPVTLPLYDTVAAPSSNEIDLSFSATQSKYDRSDEKNNNASDGCTNFPHGRNLPALKFSASFKARDGGTSTSIGNNSPYLPSRSWSTETMISATSAATTSESRCHRVNTAGTNNINVNNHSHQDVALAADSLSKIQHMDHTVDPTTAPNGVGISSTKPPQCNGNGGGYRTTLQVTTTTNTTVPQQNTTTVPSPSMSQYRQLGGGGGGGCQTADAVLSHSCTQPHHSCAVTVTNASTSTDDFDTVDSLLLDGGGCEEWELGPGDLKEESNQYYEHYSDPCLSNRQE